MSLNIVDFPIVLEGYNDAKWIFDSDETKSINGNRFTLGGSVISWRSARQTIIVRSTRNMGMLFLKGLIVKLSSWRTF